MSGKHHPEIGQGGQGTTAHPVQAQLFQDAPSIAEPQSAGAVESGNPAKALDRKTIQDILFGEGLLAVKTSVGVNTLTELQEALTRQL